MRLSSASFLFAFSLMGFVAAEFSDGQLPLDADGRVRTTEGWSYSDCGFPEFIVHIKSINVSPDPPQPGKNLTVTVTANVEEVVKEGAYADVTVKLGRIKLLSKRFDICEEARNANATVTCPVDKGEYTVIQTVALPKEIPRAKFQVEARGYTVEKDEMLCLSINVDFMKHSFMKLW